MKIRQLIQTLLRMDQNAEADMQFQPRREDGHDLMPVVQLDQDDIPTQPMICIPMEMLNGLERN